mmetsp:Transcript_6068/g.5410  ORF Transcript_6068/g.5410 Transcript_6068/m.5410 type:complete len:88 (+) Transcript_6068:1251-1514(+)
MIDYIDPEKKFIRYIISRERCLLTKTGLFIKDLRIFKNRNLKDMVIVDDLSHCFCLQMDNGIPVIRFKGNPDDTELKFLADYLLQCE